MQRVCLNHKKSSLVTIGNQAPLNHLYLHIFPFLQGATLDTLVVRTYLCSENNCELFPFVKQNKIYELFLSLSSQDTMLTEQK